MKSLILKSIKYFALSRYKAENKIQLEYKYSGLNAFNNYLSQLLIYIIYYFKPAVAPGVACVEIDDITFVNIMKVLKYYLPNHYITIILDLFVSHIYSSTFVRQNYQLQLHRTVVQKTIFLVIFSQVQSFFQSFLGSLVIQTNVLFYRTEFPLTLEYLFMLYAIKSLTIT